jgi:hypothetical protein
MCDCHISNEISVYSPGIPQTLHQWYVHNFQAVYECSGVDKLVLSWYVESYVRCWNFLIYCKGCLCYALSGDWCEGKIIVLHFRNWKFQAVTFSLMIGR